MTPAEKKDANRKDKAAERQRKRDAGLVRLEIWAPKPLHDRIKRFAALLVARARRDGG
jgi:hypothetical protein